MKKYIALFLGISGFLILSLSVYSHYLKVAPTSNSPTKSVRKNFDRIDLHRGVIREANFVPHVDWSNTIQSGGTGFAEAKVSSGGKAGSTRLQLHGTKGFGGGQLITYKGSNGQFYTAVIARMKGSDAILRSPLEVSIASPQKIWNFYADPDHPNAYGYKAIVDYALRNLRGLNKGKHVLLGDSWFDHAPRHFSDRLASRLPKAQIINAGKGGNTTQNLLNRFDSAVTSKRPNTVWIMAGTNDYNQYVKKENYARNMQQLIQKIKALGARPIIFNSSVGKPLTHSKAGKRHPSPLDTMQVLSREYYKALEGML